MTAVGVGFRREAEQDAASMGVVVGGALSGQIGQEQQALGGGEGGFGAGQEVGIVRLAGQAGGPFDHAGAVQQRRHLEPCPGEGMGEAVDQRFGIGAVAVGRDEDLRRGAERDEGVAAVDGADADGAGCGVSGSSRYDGVGGQAPFGGDCGEQAAGGGGAVGDAGHLGAGEAAGGQKLGDQSRLASSSRSVPAASVGSVTWSPVSFRRT